MVSRDSLRIHPPPPLPPMIINAVFLDYCGRSVSGRFVPKQFLLVRYTLVTGYVLNEKVLQVVRHKPDGHDKYTIDTHAKSGSWLFGYEIRDLYRYAVLQYVQ